MSITISILGLAALILLHEAGHFFVARAVGSNSKISAFDRGVSQGRNTEQQEQKKNLSNLLHRIKNR